MTTGGSEILVRTELNVDSVTNIQDLRVDDNTGLGDVAQVSYGPADRTSYLRADGKTGIGLNIVRQGQSNTLDISDGIANAVVELQPLLPEDVDLRVT